MADSRVNKVDKLSPQKRLFVYFYTGSRGDTECFGNAKRSYMRAYGFWEKLIKIDDKIGEIPLDDRYIYVTVEDDGDGPPRTEKQESPEYKKLQEERYRIDRVCEVQGSRLLNTKEVFEAAQDEFKRVHDTASVVDTELGFLIRQRENLPSKMAAIKEYNKKEGRVKERLDITSDDQPVGVVYLPQRKQPEKISTPPLKSS